MPSVLVIGASGGIGQAVCQEFARAGWHVGIHYHRGRPAADDLARVLSGHGAQACLVQADIRVAEQVRRMFEEVVAQWERLDVLILAAGTAHSRLLLRCEPATWQEVIDTNLTGVFHCLQAGGQLMVQQRQGGILLVGSYAGLQGGAGQAAYSASKAGLVGLARSAAREWGPANIRVNMILPGWHATALTSGAMPEPEELRDHLLARTPSLTGIARAVYMLATLPDASGQIWNLDSRLL